VIPTTPVAAHSKSTHSSAPQASNPRVNLQDKGTNPQTHDRYFLDSNTGITLVQRPDGGHHFSKNRGTIAVGSQYEQLVLQEYAKMMPSAAVQQKDVSQPAAIASLINVQEQREIQALWNALNDYLAPKRSFLRRTFHLHNRHWLNEVERFIQDKQAAMNGKTLRLQEMKDQLREIFAQPLHKKPVNQGGHIDRIIQRWDIQLVNQDATQPAVGSQPF